MQNGKGIDAETAAAAGIQAGEPIIDSNGNDSEEVWDKMYEVGLRGMMSDDILLLVKRAAKLGKYV